MTDLPAKEGFAILRQNWQQIASVETRRQLLQAWGYNSLQRHNRIHPHLLDVLNLGVRDRSPEVGDSSLHYLRLITFQDFAEDIPAYKSWYQTNRHKAVTKVIAESVQRLVEDIKQMRGEEFYERIRRLYEISSTFQYVPAAESADRSQTSFSARLVQRRAAVLRYGVVQGFSGDRRVLCHVRFQT